MKKYGLILVGVTVVGMISAQETARITFRETVKFELPVVEGLDSAMLAAFPKERSVEKDLYYTPGASLYRPAPPKIASEDVRMDNEQGGIVINMEEPEESVYTDLEAKKVIEQRDLMGRKFLIEKPLETPQWKLTGKQKMILNYMCQEALIQDSVQTISVWFAPQLQVASGPGVFLGFPGMVLEVEMNDGDFRLTAINIDPAAFDPGLIACPKEGKKVTEEKFRAMVEEKQREMQEQYGGDGNTVIRVIRN